MTHFIFFNAIANLLAAIICLLAGIFVLLRYRSQLHLLYFLSTLGVFWSGFSEMLVRLAPNIGFAYFWGGQRALGVLLAVACYLHFALFFSRARVKWLPLLSYPAAVIMYVLIVSTPYYIAGFEKKFFGYIYVPGKWNLSFLMFYLLYILLGLFFVFRVWLKAKEFYRRRQSSIILVSTFLFVSIGTAFDQILLMLRLPTLPIAIFTTSFAFCLIGYAILRYEPVASVSKEDVAEAAAGALLDAMFIADAEQKINFANPAASRLTGYRKDDLLGKNIRELLPKEEGTGLIIKRKGKSGLVDLKIFSIFGGRGTIYLARDISSKFLSEQAVRRLNMELEKKINWEKKIEEFLFRFSKVTNIKMLEELWSEIQKEDQVTVSSLMPVYRVAQEKLKLFEETRVVRNELAKKTKELEKLNSLMDGREKILGELEEEYKRLKT